MKKLLILALTCIFTFVSSVQASCVDDCYQEFYSGENGCYIGFVQDAGYGTQAQLGTASLALAQCLQANATAMGDCLFGCLGAPSFPGNPQAIAPPIQDPPCFRYADNTATFTAPVDSVTIDTVEMVKFILMIDSVNMLVLDMDSTASDGFSTTINLSSLTPGYHVVMMHMFNEDFTAGLIGTSGQIIQVEVCDPPASAAVPVLSFKWLLLIGLVMMGGAAATLFRFYN